MPLVACGRDRSRWPFTRFEIEADRSANRGVHHEEPSHHYLGFAETQWRLFMKESPRRVKPLLYVYRVLLTGIWLMRTGKVEANLLNLNSEFKLPQIEPLVAQKLAGPEQSELGDAEVSHHQLEYERLRQVLVEAHIASHLREAPSEQTKRELNTLLLQLRGCELPHLEVRAEEALNDPSKRLLLGDAEAKLQR